MKTVTKTAFANLKQNKGRNILCGVAIALTALLITMILTVGFAFISIQAEATNIYYPTWQFMFREVNQENADALKLSDEIESIGLREDFGKIADDDADIRMVSLDDKAFELSKIELAEGNYPKEENDLVVSQGVLDELGIKASIGDEIKVSYQNIEGDELGYEKEHVFRICGFVETTKENLEEKKYAVFGSMDFVKKTIPAEDIEYRVMLRFNNVENKTTDFISKMAYTIGEKFEVLEGNVVENKEYLLANYVDPSFFSGIFIIVLIVIIAGVMTIYSIYYVSMIPKIQEFGKLKAMGATRHQIRQIVFREGIFVTILAIPIGLVINAILSRPVVTLMFSFADSVDGMGMVMKTLLEENSVSFFRWWIYLIAIAATFFTVIISLMKPLHIASRISPIEAIRYEGSISSGKHERRGYFNLNLLRVTKANLLRNKKRTLITIATLGSMGVLFMIVATVITCANPKEIAKENIELDFSIRVDVIEGDKMKPDREWTVLQQNNPMDETFLKNVRDISGVEEVRVKTCVTAELLDYKDGEDPWIASLKGLDDTYAKIVEEGIIEGQVTYEELKKGDKVILNETALLWLPDLKVGDILRMNCLIGGDIVEKNLEIAAIGRYSHALTMETFLIPASVLKDMNPYNINYNCEIKAQDGEAQEVEEALNVLIEKTGTMRMESYAGEVAMWEEMVQLFSVTGYTFLAILGGVGIMNLINTMINSIHTRKRELGIMQAIGLSEKQLLKMLQIEGLFYTFGTLLLSVGLGGIAGYGVFLWMRQEKLMNITRYHFPFIQSIILIAIIAVIQILLTYLITRNFRKISLIDRIRTSD